MPRQATTAMIQVQVPPMVPLEPPPRSWKLVSIGAIVRPEAIHQATPRQTSSPPSVTMKAGTPA